MGSNANFSAPLANSQNFASPTNSIDPTLQVTQQQIQRQSDLAAALRQMSFEPIDASNGGNIAWTQGMAKIAQAIAGQVVQGRADKKQIQLNKDYQTSLGASGLYGSNTQPRGGDYHSSGVGGQAPPPASIAPPAPTMDVPDANNAPPSGVPQAPSPTMPQPGQADQLAALPPQAAPQQQGQFVPGPLSLGRDVRQNVILAQQYPEQYGKSLIDNVAKGSAPTEVEILQQHLQQAVSSGDMGAAQALMAQLNKVNRLPMESVRGGSLGFDPNSNTWRYAPKLGDNISPTLDSNGNVTGVGMLPGGEGAIRATSAAEASGKGAGSSPYELVTVVDPITGKGHQVTKASLLPGGGGAPPPLSPSGSGAPNTGTVGGYYANLGRGAPGPTSGNMGNVSSLGPGEQSSLTTAGTNSANIFNEAITGAQTGKDALRALSNIATAAKGLSTGTGAGKLSAAKSGFNALTDGLGVSDLINPVLAPYGKQVGFNRDQIAKFNEMQKNVSNLADQLSKGGGSTGTDSRLTNAINSLPSDHYSPAAIQEVGWNLAAQAQRNVSYGSVAAQWQAHHGPVDGAAMQSAWQKAYNPDLFYHMQRGDLNAWEKSMSPTAQAQIRNQARQLRSLGAFQ